MPTVSCPARIRATVEIPADKSISHRSLIFNGIADGKARIEGLLESEDVRSTASCLAALGAEIEWPAGSASAVVMGRGLHGLFEAEDVLDCGNSGTTMRLLTGLLAAHPLLSILTGDNSLRSRPMARIVAPLRKMGAQISGRRGDTLAPLVIKGRNLNATAYDSPVASAQVKSAVLLAGLYADGETSVTEPARSRDHTERMLRAMGAPVVEREGRVTISPPARLEPLSLRVPGDISSAAPWLVLASCHPDAEILLKSVNTNPTRTGILDILRAMGGYVEVLEERMTGGEPVADLLVRSAQLTGTTVSGALVPRAIDELPLVGLLACFAEGPTVVKDAAELLVKETDRVAALVRVLGRLGAKVTPNADGFTIHGPATELKGARLNAGGDHRIGMLAGIAGALSSGTTKIENDLAAVSYPEFWTELARVCGE
jgi:3-phosphoshikimate 1-carboxyvinyltransferase